jgi:glycosyltransferase involved in cell wall biosynthesis
MPSKRQHEAIEAVVRLWSSGVDVQLDVIGGDGPDPSYREALERTVAAEPIGDHVHLVGYVDDAWEEIAEADCVVVPSRESFGRVAVEAMLTGTPVIASHWGAAGEIVRDGETGLLYEPGDAVALAAHIRRLVEHPGEGERLAEAARAWASETFSERRHVEGLLKVLERACGSVGGRDGP